MKTVQNTIATLILLFVIGIPYKAAKASTPAPTAITNVQTFVKNTLQNEEEIRAESLKVEIEFLLTADHQMIVTNTNNTTWDAEIKRLFNYKKVMDTKLELNQVYAISISIQ